jgi:hypothetical protein
MQTLLYLDYIIEAKQQAAVPDQQLPPPPPSPEQIQAQITTANVENIQKYILFNKILSLKYQLENSEIRKTDYDIYSEAIYFLNIIINFFDGFNLNDLTITINYVLDNIIKATNLSQPDMHLFADPIQLSQALKSGEINPQQVQQAVNSGQLNPKIIQQAVQVNAKTK